MNKKEFLANKERIKTDESNYRVNDIIRCITNLLKVGSSKYIHEKYISDVGKPSEEEIKKITEHFQELGFYVTIEYLSRSWSEYFFQTNIQKNYISIELH